MPWAGDSGLAQAMGTAARAHTLEQFGLKRFLDDRDALLGEIAS